MKTFYRITSDTLFGALFVLRSCYVATRIKGSCHNLTCPKKPLILLCMFPNNPFQKANYRSSNRPMARKTPKNLTFFYEVLRLYLYITTPTSNMPQVTFAILSVSEEGQVKNTLKRCDNNCATVGFAGPQLLSNGMSSFGK